MSPTAVHNEQTPPANKPPMRLGRVEFVILMAFIQALQALSVDSMLPALGTIANDLGQHDANQRQLVVGVFLIASGVGCLLPGALADRFGRRPIMLGCVGLYVVCTLACAFVQDFNQLLVLRALLGLVCAGMMVLPAAIIRDLHSGDAMARLQSMVMMVFMVVPMIAPSMGQAVLLVASWRWIFGAMALMGLAVLVWGGFRLPETMRPEHRQPIDLVQVATSLAQVAAHRGALGYVVGAALMQGALLGYINSSQQLVAEHFGAGDRFPLVFAAMAASMAATNFINSRIVERFGARRVGHTAIFVYIAAALVHLAMASSGHESLWMFLPVMALSLCLTGFIGSNFSSIALQPFARQAGAAASVQSFLRMLTAAVLGSIIGHAYDGTARPLSVAMLMAGTACLLCVLFSENGKLFRRLHPPGTPRPIA